METNAIPIRPLELMDGKFEDFIGTWEKFVPSSVCNRVINIHQEYEKNDGGYSGNFQFPNGKLGRSDYSINLQEIDNDLTREINQYLTACVQDYCDEYHIIKEQPLVSYTVKVQKTDPGGGYHVWHGENNSFQHCTRCLAWIIYLNDIEDGGETEFLYQHKRVVPTTGTVVIWPAAFTHAHRGNPPLKETKYIITGWYYHLFTS